MRGGPLPVPRATYIMIQACRGLVAAHERGIIHRDLKPENLFICKRNDGSDLVKVLDFGIAKLHVGGDGTGLTHTGATMGTPFYMSLEQARGAKEVDHRTDIYSCGVILYEILTGAKPHPGESYNEILYHVISNEPAPLDSVRAGMPPGLAAVVHKAMAREAEDRYVSVVDLMEALIPFAGRAVTPLRTYPGQTVPTPVTAPNILAPTAVLPPAILSPKSEPDEVESTAAEAPRSHSRRLLVGALGAFGVLLVAGILWAVLGRKPELRPASADPVTGPAPTPPPPLPPAPLPEPAASPAPIAPPAEKVEGSPARPPERPPGQRQQKRSTTAAAPLGNTKAVRTVVPAAHPAESQDIPAAPQRKMVRPIDRQNPFAE